MFYFSLISELFNARKNYIEELDLIETRCKTISERINVLDHGIYNILVLLRIK